MNRSEVESIAASDCTPRCKDDEYMDMDKDVRMIN